MNVTDVVNGAWPLVGVALGIWLGSRSAHSQWLRESQLIACKQVVEGYAEIYEMLAKSRRGEILEPKWEEWNKSLTAVAFICEPSVVGAAFALDEQFYRVHWKIRHGCRSEPEWLELRKSLDGAHAIFLHAVRRQVNVRARGRIRTLGRPSDDDPMWELRSEPH